MSVDDGRQAPSVRDELHREPWRFTFLQAVRLMEDIGAGGGKRWHPPGETMHQKDELLFFRHCIELGHAANDVESLERRKDARPVMTVNVMGLAGALGPLPYSVTEAIFERNRINDRGFADFLDIFNHRLISLLYRERKKYRPALDGRAPHDGRVARVLSALLGIGTPYLRGRVVDRVHDDRALFAYTGLFAERYRSAAGLERIVADYFGVAAKVVPFVGRWQAIEDEERTAIGQTLGRNQSLGRAAVLGARVWNQAARFEVRVGPVSLERFRAFLPIGDGAFRHLVSLIRFYARQELGFDIRLVLGAGEMPRLTLGRGSGAYLGYTTWLRGRPEPPHRIDEQLRLVGCR